ncbi:MAG: Maf family protein [Acetivibrionales bacterium]
MKEIILASASPRRFELLSRLGLKFRVLPSKLEENIDLRLNAGEIAENVSFLKAENVAKKLDINAIVIGADTIVVKDRILGKPQSCAEAFNMLKLLQGSWHSVITGITVIETPGMKTIKGHEKTRVKFRELSDDEIISYIKTGEPEDKAGAYGIQGIGAILVDRIEGCYFNVVGLPLTKLSLMLKDFNISIL